MITNYPITVPVASQVVQTANFGGGIAVTVNFTLGEGNLICLTTTAGATSIRIRFDGVDPQNDDLEGADVAFVLDQDAPLWIRLPRAISSFRMRNRSAGGITVAVALFNNP